MELTLPKDKLAEWVFRLAMLAGLFYFQANFVSIKDYKIDEGRKAEAEEGKANVLNNINLTLARIDERSKNDDTKGRIAKLEEHVQALEKRIP